LGLDGKGYIPRMFSTRKASIANTFDNTEFVTKSYVDGIITRNDGLKTELSFAPFDGKIPYITCSWTDTYWDICPGMAYNTFSLVNGTKAQVFTFNLNNLVPFKPPYKLRIHYRGHCRNNFNLAGYTQYWYGKKHDNRPFGFKAVQTPGDYNLDEVEYTLASNSTCNGVSTNAHAGNKLGYYEINLPENITTLNISNANFTGTFDDGDNILDIGYLVNSSNWTLGSAGTQWFCASSSESPISHTFNTSQNAVDVKYKFGYWRYLAGSFAGWGNAIFRSYLMYISKVEVIART
jgi:hypothetical protein